MRVMYNYLSDKDCFKAGMVAKNISWHYQDILKKQLILFIILHINRTGIIFGF